MNVKNLLVEYYNVSFPAILGVNFPKDSDVSFPSLMCYLESLSHSQKEKAISNFFNYRRFLSPLTKSTPLFEFFRRIEYFPRKLLDFGCGEGSFIDLCLNTYDSIELAVGVDTDSELEDLLKDRVRDVRYYSDRSLLKGASFDLISSIHTLHHIPQYEQIPLLEELAELLVPGGYFYLVEDSWTTDQAKFSGDSNLDRLFVELSERDKISLFCQNEHWSNKWCYDKKWATLNLFYRNFESWESEFIRLGFRVQKNNIKGFDFSRLHGVPSVAIIAQKI